MLLVNFTITITIIIIIVITIIIISFVRNVAGKLMHNLLFGVNRLTDNRFLKILYKER